MNDQNSPNKKAIDVLDKLLAMPQEELQAAIESHTEGDLGRMVAESGVILEPPAKSFEETKVRAAWDYAKTKYPRASGPMRQMIADIHLDGLESGRSIGFEEGEKAVTDHFVSKTEYDQLESVIANMEKACQAAYKVAEVYEEKYQKAEKSRDRWKGWAEGLNAQLAYVFGLLTEKQKFEDGATAEIMMDQFSEFIKEEG